MECKAHHFPFEGTGGVYWDGEDFIKTSNAAIRFFCIPDMALLLRNGVFLLYISEYNL